MNKIQENVETIEARITTACILARRDPEPVRLLMAIKTVSAETIRGALIYYKNLLGENKVQELSQKYPQLAATGTEFYFIKHLQINKVKEVLKFVSCIQCADSLELVQKLNQRLQFKGRSLDIFMQVNTSYEESKFGISPENAISLVGDISKYDTLNVKGFMTIGLLSSEREGVRRCFRLLRKLKCEIKDLNLANFAPNELSMVMSNDLE